jgi:hypothetical protein
VGDEQHFYPHCKGKPQEINDATESYSSVNRGWQAFMKGMMKALMYFYQIKLCYESMMVYDEQKSVPFESNGGFMTSRM